MGFRISFFALFRCCEKGKSKPDFLHLTTADWPLSWAEEIFAALVDRGANACYTYCVRCDSTDGEDKQQSIQGFAIVTVV